MAPPEGGSAGADVDIDVESWERRLASLRDRAAALKGEAAKQEAELLHLRRTTFDDQVASEQLEAQAGTQMHEERAAQQGLESELSAMALACQKTAELDAERRTLLEAISKANLRLGQQAIAATKRADSQEEATEANRNTASRAKTLRKPLRSLGDAQAQLASNEEAERSKRRQLREVVRGRLHRHASDRAELERRWLVAVLRSKSGRTV